MINYNQDKIERLVQELLKALKNLHDLKNLSEKAFLSDEHKIGSAKYNFIVAIEAIIDISNHIISKNKFKTPEDYGDTYNLVLFEYISGDYPKNPDNEKLNNRGIYDRGLFCPTV